MTGQCPDCEVAVPKKSPACRAFFMSEHSQRAPSQDRGALTATAGHARGRGACTGSRHRVVVAAAASAQSGRCDQRCQKAAADCVVPGGLFDAVDHVVVVSWVEGGGIQGAVPYALRTCSMRARLAPKSLRPMRLALRSSTTLRVGLTQNSMSSTNLIQRVSDSARR